MEKLDPQIWKNLKEDRRKKWGNLFEKYDKPVSDTSFSVEDIEEWSKQHSKQVCSRLDSDDESSRDSTESSIESGDAIEHEKDDEDDCQNSEFEKEASTDSGQDDLNVLATLEREALQDSESVCWNLHSEEDEIISLESDEESVLCFDVETSKVKWRQPQSNLDLNTNLPCEVCGVKTNLPPSWFIRQNPGYKSQSPQCNNCLEKLSGHEQCGVPDCQVCIAIAQEFMERSLVAKHFLEESLRVLVNNDCSSSEKNAETKLDFESILSQMDFSIKKETFPEEDLPPQTERFSEEIPPLQTERFAEEKLPPHMETCAEKNLPPQMEIFTKEKLHPETELVAKEKLSPDIEAYSMENLHPRKQTLRLMTLSVSPLRLSTSQINQIVSNQNNTGLLLKTTESETRSSPKKKRKHSGSNFDSPKEKSAKLSRRCSLTPIRASKLHNASNLTSPLLLSPKMVKGKASVSPSKVPNDQQKSGVKPSIQMIASSNFNDVKNSVSLPSPDGPKVEKQSFHVVPKTLESIFCRDGGDLSTALRRKKFSLAFQGAANKTC